ncbi:hypothetical protein NL676_016867 [Syzygium grande]|nr:hypothetical protein NL676_016867 [Syzygium grande]
MTVSVFFKDARNVFKKDQLGVEIAQIALPAALALAADPIASLIDTAFIGHIGPTELAAVGVAIAIFNQVSKITIFPLVSITTSFVAEEDTIEQLHIEGQKNKNGDKRFPVDKESDVEMEELLPQSDSTSKSSSTSTSYDKMANLDNKRRHIPSASSALVIGSILGIVQTLFLIFSAKPILNYMGVKPDSPMLMPAQKYLTLRSLGAPAVLLSLAMQGIFRGFKDTKTPLYATVVGDASNIILDPLFIFVLRMGISGAAIAHVISQYLISLILLWKLMSQVDLLPPSIKDLKFERFLRNGFLLLVRVIAVTFCVTLAASFGLQPLCLLTDWLLLDKQSLQVHSLGGDYDKATSTASRVLQLGLAMGLVLSVVLVAVLQFASGLFTEDAGVLHLISVGIPFVAVTQPINALAFVFDGINYGASDFAYAAYSMVLVSVVSIVCLCSLSSAHGFIGIWIALTIYMTLRTFAGFLRIGAGMGPWGFLKN